MSHATTWTICKQIYVHVHTRIYTRTHAHLQRQTTDLGTASCEGTATDYLSPQVSNQSFKEVMSSGKPVVFGCCVFKLRS